MKTLSLIIALFIASAAFGDPAGTGRTLMRLYPSADPQQDWVVTRNRDGSETIVAWNEKKLGPKPIVTTEQVAETNAAMAAVGTIRTALLAEFAKLSPGEQALYRPAMEAVGAMLKIGNLTEAKRVIFLSPVPTDDLAAARLRLLALIPE